MKYAWTFALLFALISAGSGHAQAQRVYRIGALVTYAADYPALGGQGAVIVDKILKGARPAELPIEQPLKLYLAINLKTARAIGLDIPKEILLRADEAIE